MKVFIKTGLVVFLLLISVIANAQDKVAVMTVRAGLNLSGTDGLPRNNLSPYASARFNIGFMVDFRMTDELYLIMGLEYTAKGGKGKSYIEATDTDPAHYFINDDKPTYLQVPLHIGYLWAINKDFRLMFHGGLFAAYGLTSSKTTWTYIYDDHTHKEKIDFFGVGVSKFDWGLGGGINVEYDRYVLGLGYDRGLRNVSPGYNDGKARTRNMYITLGYMF